MVKMVLGSSNAQAGSVAQIADGYTQALAQAQSAIEQLAGTQDLAGSAYENIKSYGSSVVIPLMKAYTLYAEALKADVQKLPDDYSSSVGGEDLGAVIGTAGSWAFDYAYDHKDEMIASAKKAVDKGVRAAEDVGKNIGNAASSTLHGLGSVFG